MAANRTVTSLSIALIVFVMLTFVLAITTYVFFKQRLDEQVTAQAALAETQKARAELNTAIEEKQRLQEEVIGVAKEKTFAEIEQEKAERIAKDFAGFNEDPKTFLKLVNWLSEALAAKDGQMDKLRQDGEKSLAEKIAALEAEKVSTGQKESERERLEKDLAELKRQFGADRSNFEKLQDRLTAERQQALDETTTFQSVKTAVEAVKQFLPEKYRRPSKEGEDFDPKRAFDAAKDSEEKLRVVTKVLGDLRSIVRAKNELLAKLNVADPAVQRAVSNATPMDDRVEQFDGQVLSVNETDRTAVLQFASTAGLRPGLLFDVYDRADVRPLVAGRKGVIELLAVDGQTQARGRITRDTVRSLIGAGDRLASGLWSPGADIEVVIVGYVQFDRDRDPDIDELVSRIEAVGGRVVDSVSASTDFLVDAGLPKSIAGEGKKPPGWRDADESRWRSQTASAKNLGIKTVTVDGLLQMLGSNRDEVESGRLPRRGLERTAPR
ncbi:MAG: hypothetical protein ACK6CT_14965 [Planctomycetia bacterium]|jgi:hypothetical protein